MNKTVLSIVCLGFILALPVLQAQTGPGATGGGPGGGTGGRSGPGAATGERPAERNTNVAVAAVQEKQIYSSVAGRLRPVHSIAHTAPSAGTVMEVHVVLGQRVRKDSPLYTITRDSSTGSYAPVIVRARIGGVVSAVSVSLYNEIRSGENGVTIIDPSYLQLDVFLSDKDVHALRPGMQIEAVNAREQRIPGRLVSISPEPDYQSGLYRLHFEFILGTQEAALNWTGQFVRVDIPVETVDGIFIPQDLLVRRYGQYYIWTVSDEDTLRLTRIQTGISIDDYILVSTGLREGTRYLRQTSGRETEGMPLPQPRAE